MSSDELTSPDFIIFPDQKSMVRQIDGISKHPAHVRTTFSNDFVYNLSSDEEDGGGGVIVSTLDNPVNSEIWLYITIQK